MNCPRCKTKPKQKHHNAKWCVSCAAQLRKRPAGNLTLEQERKARKLAGTMFISELAKEVGTSDSNIDRWAKQNGVNINAFRYSDKTVAQVCGYYEKHGKIKTQKRFPDVCIRSITDQKFKRLGYKPRQVCWTAPQLLDGAKMGGLVSLVKQAKYFNRPGANKGAMRSLWSKKFGFGSGCVNGLSQYIAIHYVKSSCPYYLTSFRESSNGPRIVALWIDVERHLRDEVPKHLRAAIESLAKFQRWLHGRNVRRSVEKILEER